MSFTHGHAIMNLLLLRRGQALYWLPIVLGGMFPDLMLLIFFIYQISIGENAQRMFDEIYYEQRWQIVFGFFHGFFTYATAILICALLLKCTGDLPLALAQNNIKNRIMNSKINKKEDKDIEADGNIETYDATPRALSVTDNTDGTISGDNNDGNEERIEDHDEKHWSYHWLVGTIYFAFSAFLHSSFDFFVHHDDGHESFAPFSIWKFQSPVSYWDIDHFSWIVSPIETAAVVYSCIFIWREHRRNNRKRACLTGTTLCIVLITYLLMFIAIIFQTVNHFSNEGSEEKIHKPDYMTKDFEGYFVYFIESSVH